MRPGTPATGADSIVGHLDPPIVLKCQSFAPHLFDQLLIISLELGDRCLRLAELLKCLRAQEPAALDLTSEPIKRLTLLCKGLSLLDNLAASSIRLLNESHQLHKRLPRPLIVTHPGLQPLTDRSGRKYG